MKKLTELKFEDLSTEQKIGMVMAGIITTVKKGKEDEYGTFEENVDFVIDLIKKHSLGAVWVSPDLLKNHPDIMPRIKEAADYPVLIFTDAENGLGDYKIGRHNSIGVADSEEYAYAFGKVTAITARKMGYNVVCDPVLDLRDKAGPTGGPLRSLGPDKHRVTQLGAAIAQGLHDGGVLSVAKHYPSAFVPFDTHMGPAVSEESYETIVNYKLYPYLELSKRGLIDGVMVGHTTVNAIDPERPSSVSKKVTDVIRNLGFDGFMITDALDMMGLRAKYGDEKMKGMCIAGGVEFILPWFSAKKAYFDLKKCYEEGMFTDERLDEAVKRVLAAQHKANLLSEPKFTEITEEDAANVRAINENSVCVITDEGVPTTLPRDGKHFFAVVVKSDTDIKDGGKVTVDTFTNHWYKPEKIFKQLGELFPNSTIHAISEFPSARQNAELLSASLGYKDVVFITFAEAPAYTGSDRFTPRLIGLMDAMQLTGRITTQLHFGSPFVLDELPHIPRRLIGCVSEGSVSVGLDVLAGVKESKGKMTYKVNLK